MFNVEVDVVVFRLVVRVVVVSRDSEWVDVFIDGVFWVWVSVWNGCWWGSRCGYDGWFLFNEFLYSI